MDQRDTWDAGWGTCETYALGQKNYDYCRINQANGYYAYEVCVECGMCSGGGRKNNVFQ